MHLGKWRETDVAVKILNSLSSIGVTEAEESEVSMDAANSAGSESHESQLPEMQSPLATLEREVCCQQICKSAHSSCFWNPVGQQCHQARMRAYSTGQIVWPPL